MIETKPYGPAALKVIIECGASVDIEAAQEAQRMLVEFMPDVHAIFLGPGLKVAHPSSTGHPA